MTHGGPEPGPGDQGPAPQAPEPQAAPPTVPQTVPRLAATNPKSGRQLAMVMGSMALFFVLLVFVAMWAADKG